MSIQAIYRKILDPLAEDIEKARREGVIPEASVDPELASHMPFGSFDYLCYRLLMDDKYSLDEILDIFTGSTVAGMKISQIEGMKPQ